MEKKSTRAINLVWPGIVFAIAYWPFEACMDAWLSGEGTFSEHLFTSDPNELWMRIAINALIIGTAIYANRMIDRQQRMLGETGRLNRLLRFLSEVNQHVQRQRNPQEMFIEICNAAVEFAGFRFAWVGVTEAEGGGIKTAALASYSDACSKAVQQASADNTVPCAMASQAIAEGKPAHCNVIMRSSCKAAWRDLLLQHDCQSAAAFPIKLQNNPHGVLTVYSGESGFFHDKEISILAEAADDISFAITNLKQEEQRQHMQEVLNHIIDGTSAVTGKDFFHELTRHVAEALGVDICFVAEHLDGKARSLAIFKGGGFEENFKWSLPGTPCEHLVDGKTAVIESKIQEKYPGDQWLRDMGAESYIGIPFVCQLGKIIGHMGIVHNKAIDHAEDMLPVLEVFAVRAGIELQRIQAELVLRQRVEELERFQKATSQREFRIKELRAQNITLQQQITQLKDGQND
ncbi:MAG: GAF domain-containing protein [Mariprofundaceae bacterium]